MRVAFISFDFGEYCVRIASALAENADTLLLLPEAELAPHAHLVSPRLTVRPFAKPRLRHWLRQSRTMLRLIGEIRRFQPDVIHLQSGHLWFNLALPLLPPCPLVLTVHDVYKHMGDRGARNTPQWIVDLACRRAERLIVHAPQLATALTERLQRTEGRVHVVPHVLCGDDGDHRHIPEEPSTVLFFGRIWPYKGLDYLIRAEPLIAARVPDVRFVIAGTGEDIDRYRAMMVHPERFIIENKYIDDDERSKWFRRASVVVLPYVEASQSGVIPIAYRFGKPVVATTVGGLPAMVDDGLTGILVPPRDEVALANAVVRLLRNKELRAKCGAAGRRKIDTECSAETVAGQTLDVYRWAVKQSGEDTGAAEPRLPAALKLHSHLMHTHWQGAGLTGPDVGVRWNLRVGRFIKSYLPTLPWNDSYYYLQAQGYWVLANWRLFLHTRDTRYRDIAIEAAESMLARQRRDGGWDYPNPAWNGRTATAEGTWGSLGLIETFRHTGDERFMAAVMSWNRYLSANVGFERIGDELSVNYFAGRPTARVPNNSAFVLRFYAELADLTGDSTYLKPCGGMLTFLANAQRPHGELPYNVRGQHQNVKCWEHFQCYQYNAFQCLDLMRYHELTGDSVALRIVTGCLRFLATGVSRDGHAYFDCRNRSRAIVYHVGVLAYAFARASRFGFSGYQELSDRLYAKLVAGQKPDGGFPFSWREHYILQDRRSYPRSLSMILFHLLGGLGACIPGEDTKAQALWLAARVVR